MKPLSKSTLVAMARATAAVAMRELVEHWPTPGSDWPFETFSLLERIEAIGPFQKDCRRLVNVIDGLTPTMVENYLGAMRDFYLDPENLERWTRNEYLNNLLDAFEPLEGRSDALVRAWKRAVAPASGKRSMMAGLMMLAQIQDNEATDVLGYYWEDKDLGGPFVLEMALRLGMDADPLTSAGRVTEHPQGQKLLCRAWQRCAKHEPTFRSSMKGRELMIAETCGRLLELCPSLMEAVMMDGVPLADMATIHIDTKDGIYAQKGSAKIKSLALVQSTSGRKIPAGQMRKL